MAIENMRAEEQALQSRIDNLIAIGAATAANCIPCFEHFYEKAINNGISSDEIKRASDIAAQVKTGAHIALTNSVNELMGIDDSKDLTYCETSNRSCCG